MSLYICPQFFVLYCIVQCTLRLNYQCFMCHQIHLYHIFFQPFNTLKLDAREVIERQINIAQNYFHVIYLILKRDIVGDSNRSLTHCGGLLSLTSPNPHLVINCYTKQIILDTVYISGFE